MNKIVLAISTILLIAAIAFSICVQKEIYKHEQDIVQIQHEIDSLQKEIEKTRGNIEQSGKYTFQPETSPIFYRN